MTSGPRSVPRAASTGSTPGVLPQVTGYRILGILGRGGMGTVYRAVQTSMDREVALKVIAPDHLQDPDARSRFLREARAAGRVSHPHVITCHDAGDDGGLLYLAMELVSGGDLERARRVAGGRLGQRRAVEVLRDAALGLQAVHDAGLLHRDLKPANIFLTDDGTAKLADLGLARLQSGDDQMTTTGLTMGTPAYMSPEQAEGCEDLDIRSDIYALGATLFCLVAGRPPYQGNGAWAVAAAVIKDPFPDPQACCPDLHPGISRIIRSACARPRRERFALPRELAAACTALLEDPHLPHGTATVRDALPASSARRPVPRPLHRRPLVKARVKWRRWAPWIVGTLVVLLAAAPLSGVSKTAVTTPPALPSAAAATDPALPLLPVPVERPEATGAMTWRSGGRDLLRALDRQKTDLGYRFINDREGVLLLGEKPVTQPRWAVIDRPVPEEFDLEFAWTDRTGVSRADIAVAFPYRQQVSAFMAGVGNRYVSLGNVRVAMPTTYRGRDGRLEGRLRVRTTGLEVVLSDGTTVRCAPTDAAVNRRIPAPFTIGCHPSRTQILLHRLVLHPPAGTLVVTTSTPSVTIP